MQVVLVLFTADGQRRSFSLPRDITVIGRREDCDLRIPLGEVSRKHCRFIIENGSLKLEDVGSSNGTFHNGQRVQQAMVEPGDTVQVGPVVFTVQIDGDPPDDQIQPPAQAADANDTSVTPGLEEETTQRPAEPPAEAGDEVVELGLEEIEEIREEQDKK